jgi:hypothetical protein
MYGEFRQLNPHLEFSCQGRASPDPACRLSIQNTPLKKDPPPCILN